MRNHRQLKELPSLMVGIMPVGVLKAICRHSDNKVRVPYTYTPSIGRINDSNASNVVNIPQKWLNWLAVKVSCIWWWILIAVKPTPSFSARFHNMPSTFDIPLTFAIPVLENKFRDIYDFYIYPVVCWIQPSLFHRESWMGSVLRNMIVTETSKSL